MAENEQLAHPLRAPVEFDSAGLLTPRADYAGNGFGSAKVEKRKRGVHL